MPNYFPITVGLPIVILSSAAIILLPAPVEIIRVDGSLQALSTGSFVAVVMDGDRNVLASLSWSAPGQATIRPGPYGGKVSTLIFDVTGIGVGASGCYITVWCNQGVEQNG